MEQTKQKSFGLSALYIVLLFISGLSGEVEYTLSWALIALSPLLAYLACLHHRKVGLWGSILFTVCAVIGLDISDQIYFRLDTSWAIVTLLAAIYQPRILNRDIPNKLKTDIRSLGFLCVVTVLISGFMLSVNLDAEIFSSFALHYLFIPFAFYVFMIKGGAQVQHVLAIITGLFIVTLAPQLVAGTDDVEFGMLTGSVSTFVLFSILTLVLFKLDKFRNNGPLVKSDFIIASFAMLMALGLGVIGQWLGALDGVLSDIHNYLSGGMSRDVAGLVENSDLDDADRIVVTASRKVDYFPLSNGMLWMALPAGILLGKAFQNRWVPALVVISFLFLFLGIVGVEDIFDEDSFFEFDFLNTYVQIILAMIFAKIGQSVFYRAGFEPKKENYSPSYIKHPIKRDDKPAIDYYDRHAFHELKNEIRSSQDVARTYLESMSFNPLKFTLAEAYHASKIAALIGVVSSSIYWICVVVFEDVSLGVFGLSTTIIVNWFHSILIAFLVPYTVLFVALFASRFILPIFKDTGVSVEAFRDSYVMHDGAIGFRAQQLAAISLVCITQIMAMSDGDELKYDAVWQNFLIIPLLLGAVFSIFVLPMLFWVTNVKIPLDSLRLFKKTSNREATFPLLKHFFASILAVTLVSIPVGILNTFKGITPDGISSFFVEADAKRLREEKIEQEKLIKRQKEADAAALRFKEVDAAGFLSDYESFFNASRSNEDILPLREKARMQVNYINTKKRLPDGTQCQFSSEGDNVQIEGYIPAYTDLKPVPAVFETFTETLVVQEASRQGDTFQTVTDTIVVQPTVLEYVVSPPRFETFSDFVIFKNDERDVAAVVRRGMKAPATVDERVIPAVTKKVTRRVVFSSPNPNGATIPAVTKQETRRVVKIPARTVEIVRPARKVTLEATICK